MKEKETKTANTEIWENLTDEQKHDYIYSWDYVSLCEAAANFEFLTGKQQKRLLSVQKPAVRSFIANFQWKKLTTAQRNVLVNDCNPDVRSKTVQNWADLTPEQRANLFSDDYVSVRREVAKQLKHLTPDQIETLVNDESDFVREAVAYEWEYLTAEQQEKLMDDGDYSVLYAIARQWDHLTAKQREQLLNDANEMVREMVRDRKNAA